MIAAALSHQAGSCDLAASKQSRLPGETDVGSDFRLFRISISECLDTFQDDKGQSSFCSHTPREEHQDLSDLPHRRGSKKTVQQVYSMCNRHKNSRSLQAQHGSNNEVSEKLIRILAIGALGLCPVSEMLRCQLPLGPKP